MTSQFRPWPLPQDLNDLHKEMMSFAVTVNTKSAANKAGRGPLAYKALQRLHRNAIATHLAVRELCESGWTPISPVLLRTIMDVLVGVYAVGREPNDGEWMGFRFVAHSLIEAMVEDDAGPQHRAGNALQIAFLKNCLSSADVVRAKNTIAAYEMRVPAFWYYPEIPKPGDAISQKMPQLFPLWKALCGYTHGSDIGSVLFADDPDNLGISPEEHPLKTRIAIVATSRLLLEISHARSQCEGVSDDSEYRRVLGDYIKPQQNKTMT